MLALVVALALALGWVTFMWHPGAGRTPPHRELALREAPRGGDFVLDSHRGRVALEDLRGQVVVLYFGYTRCPDICPTSLGLLTSALDSLTSEELARVQGLFISVDPHRDSLERLRAYGAYFHPKILGITGTADEVAKVAARYGVSYRRMTVDSAMEYVVDHSAYTYVIDRNGHLVETLPHGTSPQRTVQVLRKLLKIREGFFQG